MGAVDNLFALRMLKMLIQPFNQSDAYRLGVIDSNGNVKVEPSKMTSAQKNAYDLLDRIVFTIKRLLNRLPGGESQLKNLIAAYYLVRECYERDDDMITEQQLNDIVDLLNSGVVLAEEQLDVEMFLEDFGIGGAVGQSGPAAGVTVGGVSPDKVNGVASVGLPRKDDPAPVIRKGKRKSPIEFFQRPLPVLVGQGQAPAGNNAGYASMAPGAVTAYTGTSTNIGT